MSPVRLAGYPIVPRRNLQRPTRCLVAVARVKFRLLVAVEVDFRVSPRTARAGQVLRSHAAPTVETKATMD